MLPAAGLTTVADADHQRISLPVKVFATYFAAVRGQRIHSHQTVNKIGDAAQRGFKFFRRFGGNAGAKTARRHIDKTGFIIDPGHINFHRVSGNRQFQRFVQRFRNTGAGGKIVGSAERQKAQCRGYAVADLDERGRHFINGTVSAAGNHRFNAQSTGFINVTLRVAFFPGYPNVNLYAFVAK